MTQWDRILREEWYSKEEPEDIVIDFVGLLKETGRRLRVLDLGCGAGRHQIHMAKQGFEAHGIDISQTGLDLAKDRLKKQGLTTYLVKGDMKTLPYTCSYFDALVCMHAIYHQRLQEICQTISEIHRVLKPNGLMLSNFLSTRTFSYKKGLEVEKNTFVEQEGAEKGVLHHFTDQEEIERLWANFKIIDLELLEKEVEGKLRSRWILVAQA